jgi:hypothetical protein
MLTFPKNTFVAFACAAVVGGCASGAQVIRRDHQGGEIAVWGPVVPATETARNVIIAHCEGRFSVGAGADDLGLGAAQPSVSLVATESTADVPAGARMFAYRCLRPTATHNRNTMAFLRGGFER